MTFFGYPSYEAYRAAFRKAAQRQEIDTSLGATSYQVAMLVAQQRKASHPERMAALVEQDSIRHNPDTYYYFWDDDDPQRRGRIFLRRLRWVHWDGGAGQVDAVKVEDRKRSTWWVCSDFWRQGRPERMNVRIKWQGEVIQLVGETRPTDVQAIMNIRSEAARREGNHESVNEAVAREWSEGKRDVPPLRARHRKRRLASIEGVV